MIKFGWEAEYARCESCGVMRRKEDLKDRHCADNFCARVEVLEQFAAFTPGIDSFNDYMTAFRVYDPNAPRDKQTAQAGLEQKRAKRAETREAKARATCEVCGTGIEQKATGRLRTTCSHKCRRSKKVRAA